MADIITLSFEQFNKVTPVLPSRFSSKILDLKNEYSCFRDSNKQPKITSEKHWIESKIRKPSLFSSMVADEKKQFLSIMNKLTPENLSILYEKYKSSISETHVDIYVDTCFEYIQRSPQFSRTYVDFLQLLSKHMKIMPQLHEIIHNFLNTQQWKPGHIPEDDCYDEFCNYVKWKKMVTGYIQAIVYMIHLRLLPAEIIRKLTKTIVLQCEHTNCVKEIEIYLSHLYECLQSKYCPYEQIRICITKLEISTGLTSAVKFKMLDIQEACAKKMKNIK